MFLPLIRTLLAVGAMLAFAALGGGASATPRSAVAEVPLQHSVLGSTAFKISKTVQSDRWNKLLQSAAEQIAIVSGECEAVDELVCRSSPTKRLARAVRAARSVQPQRQLQMINEAVNRMIRYASDPDEYGAPDHWATLKETLTRARGDCEDIAFTKMWALRAAGIEPSAIRLVLVRNFSQNKDHAFLVVAIGSEKFILDNRTDRVLSDSEPFDHTPMVSLSSEGAWIHGYKLATRIAQLDRAH